jgi:hypothetical protein
MFLREIMYYILFLFFVLWSVMIGYILLENLDVPEQTDWWDLVEQAIDRETQTSIRAGWFRPTGHHTEDTGFADRRNSGFILGRD